MTPILVSKKITDAVSLTSSTLALANYRVIPVVAPLTHAVLTHEVLGVHQTTSGIDVSLYLFIAPHPLPTDITTVAGLVDGGHAVEYDLRINPGDHLSLEQDVMRDDEALYVISVGGDVNVTCKGPGFDTAKDDLSTDLDALSYVPTGGTPPVVVPPTPTAATITAAATYTAADNATIKLDLTAMYKSDLIASPDTLKSITWTYTPYVAGTVGTPVSVTETTTSFTYDSVNKVYTKAIPTISVNGATKWVVKAEFETTSGVVDTVSEDILVADVSAYVPVYTLTPPTFTVTGMFAATDDVSKLMLHVDVSQVSGLQAGDTLKHVSYTVTPTGATAVSGQDEVPTYDILTGRTVKDIPNVASSTNGWDITVKYISTNGVTATSAPVHFNLSSVWAYASIVNVTVTAEATYTKADNSEMKLKLTAGDDTSAAVGDTLSSITWVYIPYVGNVAGTPEIQAEPTPLVMIETVNGTYGEDFLDIPVSATVTKWKYIVIYETACHAKAQMEGWINKDTDIGAFSPYSATAWVEFSDAVPTPFVGGFPAGPDAIDLPDRYSKVFRITTSTPTHTATSIEALCPKSIKSGLSSIYTRDGVEVEITNGKLKYVIPEKSMMFRNMEIIVEYPSVSAELKAMGIVNEVNYSSVLTALGLSSVLWGNDQFNMFGIHGCTFTIRAKTST